MFLESHPGRTFHRVQGPLKHLVCGFCAPVDTVITIDMFTEPEMYFVAEPNIIKEVRVLFNLVLKPPAHHQTFFHCVSLCLIWILYGYSWRSFFNILCSDAREISNSWEYLWSDFFRLLPVKSLTASTLPGHLAVNFLPYLGFSTFLLRLFTYPVAWNLCTQR